MASIAATDSALAADGGGLERRALLAGPLAGEMGVLRPPSEELLAKLALALP